jgi:hypothetical protein
MARIVSIRAMRFFGRCFELTLRTKNHSVTREKVFRITFPWTLGRCFELTLRTKNHSVIREKVFRITFPWTLGLELEPDLLLSSHFNTGADVLLKPLLRINLNRFQFGCKTRNRTRFRTNLDF